MRMKIDNISSHTDFNKIYAKTIIPKVYYLKIKAPLAVQFELTNGCNQKCTFCYNVWKEGCSKSVTKQLSKHKQFKILNKIIENEIFDIIFSGGEPLIINWLEKLIKTASDNKLDTTIITNGILLTSKRVKSLKDAGLQSMQISLHHYKPEINNLLTGKNSFNKTVNGIRNAIKYFKNGGINVNMVALPQTYKDVYKMAKFLKSLGVLSFTVGTPTATGEMHKNRNLVITKEMFLEIYKQLRQAEKDFKISTGFTGGFPLCILPEFNEKTKEMISNYCDAGLNQLVIDPEGNLKPCVCLSEKLGNILTDDLQKIWLKTKFLLDIRQLKYVPKECKKCEYISICRGGCRASARGYFGKIDSKDPLMN